jgi:hypothetical protein
LKFRLELNLDIEIELKASIHGDLTLAVNELACRKSINGFEQLFRKLRGTAYISYSLMNCGRQRNK